MAKSIIFTTRNIWLFLPILPRNNMSENTWKKLFPHQKPCQGFLNSLINVIFSCILTARWVYYGRIIDKFNDSCAIAIFCCRSNIIKMASYSRNVVYHACHIFWTSSVTRTFFVFLLLAYHKLQAWKVSANSRLGNNYCEIPLIGRLPAGVDTTSYPGFYLRSRCPPAAKEAAGGHRERG